ncbi:hypothetical protein PR048_008090 [Dryococelus australis]|uniref:Uncharacterized protein n=1 Tax=Dryococelus australis TaxID=614101 RepID=A0ABQ9HW45_9NEOP|nr:hypothetical protein PR048_008090 [Dryococelus australis]
MVGEKIAEKDTSLRQAISVHRSAVTLRFLATGDSYSSLQYLFRIPKQCIGQIVLDVPPLEGTASQPNPERILLGTVSRTHYRTCTGVKLAKLLRYGKCSLGQNEKREQREIPEKTPRPATSFSKIPTCENPGMTPPGIEPGSPRCAQGSSHWSESEEGRVILNGGNSADDARRGRVAVDGLPLTELTGGARALQVTLLLRTTSPPPLAQCSQLRDCKLQNPTPPQVQHDRPAPERTRFPSRQVDAAPGRQHQSGHRVSECVRACVITCYVGGRRGVRHGQSSGRDRRFQRRLLQEFRVAEPAFDTKSVKKQRLDYTSNFLWHRLVPTTPGRQAGAQVLLIAPPGGCSTLDMVRSFTKGEKGRSSMRPRPDRVPDHKFLSRDGHCASPPPPPFRPEGSQCLGRGGEEAVASPTLVARPMCGPTIVEHAAREPAPFGSPRRTMRPTPLLWRPVRPACDGGMGLSTSPGYYRHHCRRASEVVLPLPLLAVHLQEGFDVTTSDVYTNTGSRKSNPSCGPTGSKLAESSRANVQAKQTGTPESTWLTMRVGTVFVQTWERTTCDVVVVYLSWGNELPESLREKFAARNERIFAECTRGSEMASVVECRYIGAVVVVLRGGGGGKLAWFRSGLHSRWSEVVGR